MSLTEMKICRFCLAENVTLFNLYEKLEEEVDMNIKASAVTNLEIHENDDLPRVICQPCSNSVSGWYDFKRICRKSDFALQFYLKTGRFPNKAALVQSVGVQVQTNFINYVNVSPEKSPIKIPKRKLEETPEKMAENPPRTIKRKLGDLNGSRVKRLRRSTLKQNEDIQESDDDWEDVDEDIDDDIEEFLKENREVPNTDEASLSDTVEVKNELKNLTLLQESDSEMLNLEITNNIKFNDECDDIKLENPISSSDNDQDENKECLRNGIANVKSELESLVEKSENVSPSKNSDKTAGTLNDNVKIDELEYQSHIVDIDLPSTIKEKLIDTAETIELILKGSEETIDSDTLSSKSNTEDTSQASTMEVDDAEYNQPAPTRPENVETVKNVFELSNEIDKSLTSEVDNNSKNVNEMETDFLNSSPIINSPSESTSNSSNISAEKNELEGDANSEEINVFNEPQIEEMIEDKLKSSIEESQKSIDKSSPPEEKEMTEQESEFDSKTIIDSNAIAEISTDKLGNEISPSEFSTEMLEVNETKVENSSDSRVVDHLAEDQLGEDLVSSDKSLHSENNDPINISFTSRQEETGAEIIINKNVIENVSLPSEIQSSDFVETDEVENGNMEILSVEKVEGLAEETDELELIKNDMVDDGEILEETNFEKLIASECLEETVKENDQIEHVEKNQELSVNFGKITNLETTTVENNIERLETQDILKTFDQSEIVDSEVCSNCDTFEKTEYVQDSIEELNEPAKIEEIPKMIAISTSSKTETIKDVLKDGNNIESETPLIIEKIDEESKKTLEETENEYSCSESCKAAEEESLMKHEEKTDVLIAENFNSINKSQSHETMEFENEELVDFSENAGNAGMEETAEDISKKTENEEKEIAFITEEIENKNTNEGMEYASSNSESRILEVSLKPEEKSDVLITENFNTNEQSFEAMDFENEELADLSKNAGMEEEIKEIVKETKIAGKETELIAEKMEEKNKQIHTEVENEFSSPETHEMTKYFLEDSLKESVTITENFGINQCEMETMECENEVMDEKVGTENEPKETLLLTTENVDENKLTHEEMENKSNYFKTCQITEEPPETEMMDDETEEMTEEVENETELVEANDEELENEGIVPQETEKLLPVNENKIDPENERLDPDQKEDLNESNNTQCSEDAKNTSSKDFDTLIKDNKKLNETVVEENPQEENQMGNEEDDEEEFDIMFEVEESDEEDLGVLMNETNESENNSKNYSMFQCPYCGKCMNSKILWKEVHVKFCQPKIKEELDSTINEDLSIPNEENSKEPLNESQINENLEKSDSEEDEDMENETEQKIFVLSPQQINQMPNLEVTPDKLNRAINETTPKKQSPTIENRVIQSPGQRAILEQRINISKSQIEMLIAQGKLEIKDGKISVKNSN